MLQFKSSHYLQYVQIKYGGLTSDAFLHVGNVSTYTIQAKVCGQLWSIAASLNIPLQNNGH